MTSKFVFEARSIRSDADERMASSMTPKGNRLWKMYVDNKEKEGEACKHSVASLVLKYSRFAEKKMHTIKDVPAEKVLFIYKHFETVHDPASIKQIQKKFSEFDVTFGTKGNVIKYSKRDAEKRDDEKKGDGKKKGDGDKKDGGEKKKVIKRASVEFIEVTPSKKGRTEDDDGKEMNTAEATLQKLESIMKDNEKSTEDKMNEVNSVLAARKK
ncbi:hypothetical protein PRIPAC_93753 [Pristionchus pacificus]|uniref:Uncharacterized protein n=1 Tax=Pristionchus pacificus TaxID=54126 RepID=A0A2A6BR83_PRIPA|nr:hypothetical protein PRIPAC_93753 [Pristionchus pacificus]|eukprot:PDM68261.1 hypothetical protein PRIPAC_46305 [Pristionchus pacificus]